MQGVGWKVEFIDRTLSQDEEAEEFWAWYEDMTVSLKYKLYEVTEFGLGS